MKRLNSRAKGCRGEREAAKYLTSIGFPCSRNGRNGISTGDLHGLEACLPNVHIEVKFGYAAMDLHTADLRAAWEQAATMGTFGGMPVYLTIPVPAVLWRPLRKPWRLTWHNGNGLVTTTGDDEIRKQLLELNGDAADAAGGG